ncbi:MAG: hypothetical protein R3185_01750, partial [Candidatus Thermoplasmatota archaeon]|nr:hypothetical protein [Candidatus Thermoplasmatota archaeon]
MRTSWLVALALLTMLLPAPALAHHEKPGLEDRIIVATGAPGITWRSVAFAPDGSHALMVGQFQGESGSRDLIARWTPADGVEEVYNRSGTGLVDVAFREDGTSLVVGLQNTLLLGEPGSYRNIWNETSFHDQGLD